MLRTIERNIARNRMKDMEFDHVNKRMKIRADYESAPSKIKIAKMEKTRQGRGKLDLIGRANPQAWKRHPEKAKA